jgi:uncharacterized protein YndB with AHSA1/START domain
VDTKGNTVPVPARPGEPAKITLISDCAIMITRMFEAPRDAVFDAWTRAERVAQWWDPSGVPLAVCEIDLRPQGGFRFVHRSPEGTGHAFAGTYREVTPPSRLVLAIPAPGGGETVGVLVFDVVDGRTLLTMTLSSASKEARDALLRMGIDAGTARTIDNLADNLGRSAGRGS